MARKTTVKATEADELLGDVQDGGTKGTSVETKAVA